MPHPSSLSDEQLRAQCTVRRSRRGGPGGQHRNKVETAIELVHEPTGVSAQAAERRSQAENLAVALRRLRVNLALAVRADCPADRQPGECWQARLSGDRIRVSPRHADFPALLAEALDFLSAVGGEVPLAAGRLRVTSSQLLRLLRSEPAAWTWLARLRESRGLPRLS